MSDAQQAGRADATRVRIREFVLEQFPMARQQRPADDASLLESGIVDSLGILEIVNFLTEAFGIEVSDEDLLPDHFDSITALATFVERRRDAG